MYREKLVERVPDTAMYIRGFRTRARTRGMGLDLAEESLIEALLLLLILRNVCQFKGF